MKLRVHLPEMNSSIVNSFCLSPSENHRVDNPLVKLESLDSVMEESQREKMSERNFRDLCDAITIELPETKNRLSTNASIILSPLIESRSIKIQQGNSLATSTDEKTRLLDYCYQTRRIRLMMVMMSRFLSLKQY